MQLWGGKMVELLRLLINVYSAAILFVLFILYAVEDLAGLLPAPMSAEVLLDFICGGLLIKKCWQDASQRE
jgi:hypothetical protein